MVQSQDQKSAVISDNEIKNNESECADAPSISKSDTPFLYFTVLTATLVMFAGGATFVWQSPATIKLISNDTEINPLGRPIETIEISMMVAIPQFVSILGGFSLPKLADIMGRKKALQFIALALLMSILGTAFSNTVYLYIIFLTINGNIYYGIWGLLPIYLTEISEDHNRARFGCIMALCMPLGQLYCYIVGSFFSIRNFTLMSAIPLIPFLTLFFLVPESPVYLLAIGKKEDCVKALKRLRSNKSDKQIEQDLQKISDGLDKTENTNFRLVTIFNSKEGRLGFCLAVLPHVVQFLSGLPIIMLLLAPIFNETGTLPGNTIAMIVGTVKVISYFFTSQVIERTGRKPLLITSSIGAGISATILGVFFYLKHINSSATEHLQFLPLLAVILYVIFYSLGLGPIPIAIMSELFPSDLRSVAVGCVSAVAVTVLSIYCFAFPLLAEYIGTHWCMWLFAVNSFIGALTIFFILPETKGKSLIEIQKMLREY